QIHAAAALNVARRALGVFGDRAVLDACVSSVRPTRRADLNAAAGGGRGVPRNDAVEDQQIAGRIDAATPRIIRKARRIGRASGDQAFIHEDAVFRVDRAAADGHALVVGAGLAVFRPRMVERDVAGREYAAAGRGAEVAFAEIFASVRHRDVGDGQ